MNHHVAVATSLSSITQQETTETTPTTPMIVTSSTTDTNTTLPDTTTTTTTTALSTNDDMSNDIHNTNNSIASSSMLSLSNSSVIVYNFIYMSILFSLNHGCVVACLSLATSQLGSSLGSYQSGLLYITYSISGLIGSTYVVKELGSRNALIFGMGLYCIYVITFYIAATTSINHDHGNNNITTFIVTIGAIFGGWGAGFLWTAQGTYFTRAAQLYYSIKSTGNEHRHIDNTVTSSLLSSSQVRVPSLEDVTSKLASRFAFIYLALEIGLRSLSTIALNTLHLSWSNVFAIYAVVAILSTVLMISVQALPDDVPLLLESENTNSMSIFWYKATAAWRLLRNDRKMKYMIGLNAVFGLTAAFLTSYINGTVVRYVLGNDSYVGLYTAWVSCVAAVCSVLFGSLGTTSYRKGYILMLGAVCFMCVAGSFILQPYIVPSESQRQQWNWISLLGIYTLHGIGRSTFEGTLKSTFADYFAYEKEGAFANIILQNGISSAIGFAFTFILHCSNHNQERYGPYCVTYKDGSVHDVITFEILIVIVAILAILGYQRASTIRQYEISQVVYENVPNTIL